MQLEFSRIKDKILSGGRLDLTEGMYLFDLEDFEPVRALAEEVTVKNHGNEVFYVLNQHVNYSNVCVLRKVCKFCSFARLPGEDKSYTLTIEEIMKKVSIGADLGVTELHIVGGLHPHLPFSYYTDMLGSIHAAFPSIQLKCFTAVEIDHLARMSRQSHDWVLAELKSAGLKSLTGGGIEIMSERVRNLICKQKLDANGWISIVKKAHQAGIRSNATLLFGHVETKEEILEHLIELRKLQDDTHGFMSFIPLRFHPEGNALSHLTGPSDDLTLRVVAISRLMLDNFKYIKSYWISMGIDLARRAIFHGANDVDGTVLEEHIYHMAGSNTPFEMEVSKIKKLIQDAGRIPQERNALYQKISRSESGLIMGVA